MVRTLARHTGILLSERAQDGWRWRGRCVKLVDGTGILMPDTVANQACYPQLSSQAPGVGSPLARLVGVICLSTGALLDAAMGPHVGKGTSELGLWRRLTSAFSAGDVMLKERRCVQAHDFGCSRHGGERCECVDGEIVVDQHHTLRTAGSATGIEHRGEIAAVAHGIGHRHRGVQQRFVVQGVGGGGAPARRATRASSCR
jgi:hypothetical protein